MAQWGCSLSQNGAGKTGRKDICDDRNGQLSIPRNLMNAARVNKLILNDRWGRRFHDNEEVEIGVRDWLRMEEYDLCRDGILACVV